MGSLKAIRTRITSVKNTQKITKAMKMVSASKLRRAQNAAIASRPYASKLETLVGHVLARVPDAAHPLLTVSEDGAAPALVLLITSDRGLCGGYNTNLCKATEVFLRSLPGAFVLESIGKKGADHARRREHRLDSRLPMPVPTQAADVARRISAYVQQRYVAGEISSAHVIFSHFKSAISQVPTVEQLLPIVAPAGAHPEHEAHTPQEYLFEPTPRALLDHLLPRLVEVRVLHALLEAGASEQAARMAAMDSATRNASSMISTLTLDMNRARQAAITKELMEIIGGAEALNG